MRVNQLYVLELKKQKQAGREKEGVVERKNALEVLRIFFLELGEERLIGKGNESDFLRDFKSAEGGIEGYIMGWESHLKLKNIKDAK